MRPTLVYVLASAGPGARGVIPYAWDPVRGSLHPVQLAGLGSFLKKVANTVHKVVTAPLRAISPSLVKPLDKINSNVVNTADKIHTKINKAAQRIGKWAKKNWKWIVIAAAIVLTIYTMGAGASFAAKMVSGYMKLKAIVVAKVAGMASWKGATMTLAQQAMGRLVGGAQMGELPPEEVEALANANAQAGEVVIPPELLAYLQARAGGESAVQAVVDGEMQAEEPDADPAMSVSVTQGTVDGSVEAGERAAAAAAAATPRPVVQGMATPMLNAAARASQDRYLQMLALNQAQTAGQFPQGQAGAFRAPGAAQAGGGSTPDWLLPAGIAAGVLVLVLAMR